MEAHQKRKEYKFVLASGVAELIRTEVARNLPPDRDARDGYPIISEYYDSEARCSYWQKQFGSQNRRRVRTRVYGRANAPIPPSAFVEVKHKLNGQASKRRVPVDMEAIVNFSTGRLPGKESIPEVMDRRVLSEIEGLLREQNGRPVVQIRYHRYAFDSGPEGTIRITFDIDPRCRFKMAPLAPDDPEFELPLLEEGRAIMEVKTIGPVPYWFRQLLGKHRLIPRGFSKYAAALELYEFESRKLERPVSSGRSSESTSLASSPEPGGAEKTKSPLQHS